MVRLKVPWGYAYKADDIGFNSNMVRLKGTHKGTTNAGTRVSIPIWCD